MSAPEPLHDAAPLELASARGEPLAGVLHVPRGREPRGLAVLSPCFTCTRDIAPVRSLARDLADEGFLAYRFDPAGSGQSGGRFVDATVSRYRDDLIAVARALAPRARPLHLVGHSLGGVVSVLAAAEAGAASVVTLASNAGPSALLRLIGRATFDRAVAEGSAAFDAGDGVIRPLGRELVLDLGRHDALAAAARLPGPLLAIHGDADEVVPLEAARELVARAGERARLVVVPGASHLLSRREDRATIKDAVLPFLAAPVSSG